MSEPAGGRQDYNATVRLRAIEPGEPWFLIMGRDITSADVVRDWARRAYEAGSPVALVESALQQADVLGRYPNKKIPDADHLSVAETKNLSYQFDRRAWTSRPLSGGHLIMLAERRGYAQALGRERQAETLLKNVYAVALTAIDQMPPGEATAKLQAATAAIGLHLVQTQAIESEAG